VRFKEYKAVCSKRAVYLMETQNLATDIEKPEAFLPYETSLGSLRNRVLIRLLMVPLILLILVSIYFHISFTDTLQEASRDLLCTIALQHQSEIDRFIADKLAILTSLSKTEIIEFPPRQVQMENLLNTLKGMDGTILDVGIFDSAGTHVGYAGPFDTLRGKDYGSEQWFVQLADSERDHFISDVYMGYRSQPHFIIAIKKKVGNTVWFLRMTINPYTFSRMVDQVRLTSGTNSYIVNDEGIYQIVSDEVGKPLAYAPKLPVLEDEKGIFESSGATGEYLVAYSKMKTIGWTLLVQQELDVAYAPVKRTRLGVIIITIIGVIFIVIVSLYATKTLVDRYSMSEKGRAELIDQLVQMSKMTLLGEMAAGVAHEINNPLAIIISEAGVMEDHLDPTLGGKFDAGEFRDHLQSIKEETFRCRDITHKLLGFARRSETSISLHNLNQIIVESVDLVNCEIVLENISIIMELDKNLPLVPTDGEKIKQVLVNLVRNAADAIGKGGRININTYDTVECLGIEIADTGSGILPENMEKIFLPFFTTKEVGKGTGLGLSISHGIITSLGGKISVESEVGKGTKFNILLPKKIPGFKKRVGSKQKNKNA
jgi:two-component system, NtrC family, sensor kinase